jgi:hypothetical protein
VLFGITPVGNNAEIQGLDKNDKLLLEKIAWQTYKSLKAR